jgi:hypothetical protein
MPDKVTDKMDQVDDIAETVKVLTPEAIDRIIDQNVIAPVAIGKEGWQLFGKIKSMFKKKKK